jgi:hypothetical protein
MSGVIRPETALYEPGISVATKLAVDGGRQYGEDPIAGVVLGVTDEVDGETGEVLGRLFRILDFRSAQAYNPRLIIRQVRESELDLAAAGPTSDRELRLYRRRLHWMLGQRIVGKRPKNPPTDSIERDTEAVIALLWRIELGQ